MTEVIKLDIDNNSEYSQPECTESDFIYEPENKTEIYCLRFEIWKTLIVCFGGLSKKEEVEEWFNQACKLIFEDKNEPKTE